MRRLAVSLIVSALVPTGEVSQAQDRGPARTCPRAFRSRTGEGRLRAALEGGGSLESEVAVELALAWLARHQEDDGHWDGEKRYEPDDRGADTDPGVTGLALLAFLGAGYTEDPGEYRSTVTRAVAWLIAQQDDDGCIGQGFKVGRGYHHAIAGLALAEAYGMSGTEATGRAAQEAVYYSVRRHQTPGSGWRYDPGKGADVSVTGWYVAQLKTAMFVGLRVDRSAFRGAAAFIDSCTKPGAYRGMVTYRPNFPVTPTTTAGAYPVTPTLTASAAVSRMFMGRPRSDPMLVGAANYLRAHLPHWDVETGDVNYYYWYHGSILMFQMGGHWWREWNAALRDTLIEKQRTGPRSIDGSWDPLDTRCREGGRVFTTATGALCLEVYYRHMPAASPLILDLGGGVRMDLVHIPAGEFMMGSRDAAEEVARRSGYSKAKAEWFANAYPQHRVRITRPFYMGKYEVTRGQFARFVGETGHRTDAEKVGWAYTYSGDGWGKTNGASWRNPGMVQADDHPVTCVSWNDAEAFCDWLGRKAGRKVHLPTEAEWEYACRAGTTTPFHFGSSLSSGQADFNGKYPYGGAAKGVYRQKTTAVGSFPANAWGLHDKHGNVWEWCSDRYDKGYYGKSPREDPTGPASGRYRVLRGGSFWTYGCLCRSAFRHYGPPTFRDGSFGFRVAASAAGR